MIKLIGRTLKHRYRIYDRLGESKMTTVYLARDTFTGRIVVVKTLFVRRVAEEDARNLIREIEVLRQINNRHVVALLDYALNYEDVDLEHPISFLVTKYIEGLPLKVILQKLKGLSAINTLALARQLLVALSQLHEHGIVHRDLKTDNVLVTAENRAYLIDFGIAKIVDGQTLTNTGQFAGTVGYAAPEQLENARAVDTRADLYSLGVIMAESLMGKLPSRNLDGRHQLEMSGLGAREGEEHVTDAYAVTNRLLSLAPRDRYLVPGVLHARLETLLDETVLLIPWSKLILHQTRELVTPQTAPQAPVAEDALPDYVLKVQEHTILLTAPEVMIGRATPSDPDWKPEVDVLALGLQNADTVSRLHCCLFRDADGNYQASDMGSYNGTVINGALVPNGTVYSLQAGDEIELGGVVFTFESHG